MIAYLHCSRFHWSEWASLWPWSLWSHPDFGKGQVTTNSGKYLPGFSVELINLLWCDQFIQPSRWSSLVDAGMRMPTWQTTQHRYISQERNRRASISVLKATDEKWTVSQPTQLTSIILIWFCWVHSVISVARNYCVWRLKEPCWLISRVFCLEHMYSSAVFSAAFLVPYSPSSV